MRQNEFNGWTNFETWQAALWLDEQHIFDLTGASEEFVEDMLIEIAGNMPASSMLSDIFNAWLSEVNLAEIVENKTEDSQ